MKQHTLLLLTCLLIALPATGALAQSPRLAKEATFAAAQARAAKENKLVFLEFVMTNCSHCKKFKEQVLDTKVFREFAAQHLAFIQYDILELDSLPEAERKVEAELEKKHKVERTPTIVVLSPKGKVLLRTEGYAGTPAEKIVANLRSLLPKG
jgi:thioredoxin-related protein